MTTFALNANVRNTPWRFFEKAAGRVESLITTGFMRWYAVPEDPGSTIGAYETLYHQVSMLPGSIVWGVSFAAIDGTASQYMIQMTRGDDQQRLFSTHVAGSLFASNLLDRLSPVLLAEPVTLRNGLLNVEINNTQNAARRCQLLLWVNEAEAR